MERKCEVCVSSFFKCQCSVEDQKLDELCENRELIKICQKVEQSLMFDSVYDYQLYQLCVTAERNENRRTVQTGVGKSSKRKLDKDDIMVVNKAKKSLNKGSFYSTKNSKLHRNKCDVLIESTMEITFKGKRVLVTGAGQGIGRAIAIELWRAGAKVVAISRTKSHLVSLQKEYPSIDIVDIDVGDWKKTENVIKSLGVFDALVNNAALGHSKPFLECTEEEFDTIININLKSVINISQTVARSMVENNIKGSIVNISSQASKAALKDHTIYGASKAGLDAVTRNMALELGPHGIRTNSVNPTVIMTAMGREGWSDPVKANTMLSKIPLRRFGEVNEVVDTVLFLLSDKASMINGVELPIDGGFLAT